MIKTKTLAESDTQGTSVARSVDNGLPQNNQELEGRLSSGAAGRMAPSNLSSGAQQAAKILPFPASGTGGVQRARLANNLQQTAGNAQLGRMMAEPQPASRLARDEPQDAPAALDPARDLAMGAGTTIEVEAVLRTLYQRADAAIAREAEYMISEALAQGADPATARETVARWVVEARNQAKAQIRRWDLDVLRILAEDRNTQRYGDPLGPSHQQLRYGDPSRGIRPRNNQEIIKGVTKTNPRVNRWVGRLRIAGRIMIAVDVGVSAWNVASAPEVDRPRVALREVGGLAGAAAGGWGGAKLGGMAGAAIGAWFGGAGAAPGAAIGAVMGGIGGAIGGGLLGRAAGELVADQLYPPSETAFEGGFE